jgi:uncharacterized coiled-coil protein SlyX
VGVDGGVVAALIGAGVAILGGGFKTAQVVIKSKFTELRAEGETKIAELRSKSAGQERHIEILEKSLDTKDETITELRRQNDRLMITAELQDKLFSELPSKRGGTRVIRDG